MTYLLVELLFSLFGQKFLEVHRKECAHWIVGAT